MSIVENKNAFVEPSAQSIGLSQMFTETAASTNPLYLVLTVLDRNEYTAGSSGATGSLSGNGHTLQLSSLGGDGRGAGIVFTYQASTGRYYSSVYGFLDQLTYTASGSLNDVTNLSLFGTSNLSLATSYASNVYSMMQGDASGYLGSATVVTQPKATGNGPLQATPDSIAAVANTFVGQAWNSDGCWVLASTIAAEAGASLPVESTAIDLSGQANGEWFVAFNGPAGQLGNWQALVKEGEVVVIGTPGGGGHITTCVSGSGATAQLVDNATFVNSSGKVQNTANDGSANDIIVAAPHAATQEWGGVSASSVVIYELDTPNVVCAVASETIALHGSQLLGSLFSATDPEGKSITQWQVYDTASSDSFGLGGTTYSDHSATTALTTASLGSVALLAGSIVTTDTLDVRAFNGTYWGDWTALTFVIAATAPSAPVLTAHTPNQLWTGGKAISLAVNFSDPQSQPLTYSAHLTNGQALPSWLVFNAAADTFSGTAPAAAQTLSVTVTATDTSKLATSESFSVTVVGAPVLAAQTAAQTWVEGKTIALALSANTFVDPQGQTLAYTATLSSGLALPAWLGFNAKTETFSGTAPATAQNLSIKVTATNTSGEATQESFTATVAPPKPSIVVSNPTSNQVWTDGQSATLILPPTTFTDALGLKMTFAAYEVSGPNVSSWLRFNSATGQLSGSVPSTAGGTIGIAVIATDAQNATATDFFSVTFVAGSAHLTNAVLPTFGTASLGADPLSTSTTMLAAFAIHA